MFPHRSGSHEMLTGRVKLFRLPDAPVLLLPVEVAPPAKVAPGAVVTVGDNAARATPTAALASRYCASACSTFWFETFTCSSRALRAASLYSSHQRPLERSEEHTSELQSLRHLVCRLLL